MGEEGSSADAPEGDAGSDGGTTEESAGSAGGESAGAAATTGSPDRVGFGDRAVAYIIDGLISTFTCGLGFFAWIFMEATRGDSPGKMIRDLEIANADGSEASTNTLAKRAGVKFIGFIGSLLASIIAMTGLDMVSSIVNGLSSLAGLVVFAGCFMALQDEKQALHDKVGDTAVFSTEGE